MTEGEDHRNWCPQPAWGRGVRYHKGGVGEGG